MFPEEELKLHLKWCRRIIWFQCGAMLFAVISIIWILEQPPQRYMFVLNQHGEHIATVSAVEGPATLPEVFVKWQIGEFIHNAKTVYEDKDQAGIDAQKDLLSNADAFVTDQAFKALRDYWHDGKHDPFEVGQKGWVEVELLRPALRLAGANSYQVDWRETYHDSHNAVPTTQDWRATVSVVTAAPTSRNPVGLYLKTLDWAPEAQ